MYVLLYVYVSDTHLPTYLGTPTTEINNNYFEGTNIANNVTLLLAACCLLLLSVYIHTYIYSEYVIIIIIIIMWFPVKILQTKFGVIRHHHH